MRDQFLVPVVVAALRYVQEFPDGLRIPGIQSSHVLHVFHCHADHAGEEIQDPQSHDGDCVEWQ